MENYPFLFSNKVKYRLSRHLAFWGFWWLFQVVLYAFTPGPANLNYLERLPYSMLESLIFMSNHIFLAYVLMYFVIPKYLLRDRYLATICWVMLAFLATGVLASLTSMYIVRPIVSILLLKNHIADHK